MYNDDLLELPRDEEHFWAMIEDHFAHACHVLQDYEIETREEAIESASEPMRGIAYRNIPEEYDQREYCLEMGRDLIPAVHGLIKKRKVTLEFVQQWGKLMFCHGLIAGSVFDIGDNLATTRGGVRSGIARTKDAERRWIANVYSLPQFSGMSRKQAIGAVAEYVGELIGRDDRRFPPGWLESLLDADGLLKSTYGTNLSEANSELLSALGTEGLPPLE